MKKSVSTVWGIRIPSKIKKKWLRLSRILGIPVGRLVAFVLEDWLRPNIEKIKTNVKES